MIDEIDRILPPKMATGRGLPGPRSSFAPDLLPLPWYFRDFFNRRSANYRANLPRQNEPVIVPAQMAQEEISL